MAKSDILRQGGVVDWVNPEGKKTRAFLNKEEQVIQLGTGEKLPIPQQYRTELLPQTPEEEKIAKEKGTIRGQQTIYGEDVGDFLYSMGRTGVLGGSQDYLQAITAAREPADEGQSFLAKLGENYQSKRKAREQLDVEVGERSPIASKLGQATELGVEVLNPYTRGIRGAKLLPALTVASRGTEAFTDPGGTAKEAATASILGLIGDKFSDKLAKTAARRGLIRETARDAEQAAARNVRGTEQFQRAAQETRAFNEAEKFAAQQAEAQRRGLLSEFETQQASRARAVEDISRQQQEAQRLFSEGVAQNAEKIGKVLGDKATVNAFQLEIPRFVSEGIERSAAVGTKEAKEAQRFIGDLFKGDLAGKELSQALKGLEKRINQSQGALKDLLLNFKDHLSQTLPQAIDQSRTYQKIFPTVQKTVLQAVEEGFPIQKMPGSHLQKDILKREIQETLNNYSKSDFLNAIKNNQMAPILDQAYEKSLERSYTYGGAFKGSSVNIRRQPSDLQIIRDVHARIDRRLGSRLQDLGIEVDIYPQTVQRQMGTAPHQLAGEAAQIPLPPPIQQPILPPRYTPQLRPQPAPFVPEPIPQLPPAQGLAERAGDFLENFQPQQLLRGRGGLDNPLTRLAGLKYIFGKAALPLELGGAAAVGTAKLATSPTTIGEAIRFGATRGTRALSARLSNYFQQKYPSYESGIINNPQERLDATTEIENSPYLNFEDKAYFQMKINRGKPLR